MQAIGDLQLLKRIAAENADRAAEVNRLVMRILIEASHLPPTCFHSDDFRRVVWLGVEYHFSWAQADVIGELWALAQSAPSESLNEREIKKRIGSTDDDFSIRRCFRRARPGEPRKTEA